MDVPNGPLIPNAPAAPNFAAPQYEQQRQPFIDAGLDLAMAINVLTRQWTAQQEKEQEVRERRLEEENIARAEEMEREELERQQQAEEDALILKEERKKNKGKFAPIPDRPTPTEDSIFPSQAALHKLKNHKFCELWYFSNEGLDAADATLSYADDDDALTLVSSAEGRPTLIPAANAHDRASVIQDQNLSLEQFGQGAIRIIPFLYDAGWDPAHITMHIKFWSALENHPWRFSRDKYHHRAILVYQGEQRRKWHMTISSKERRFNLSLINQDQLDDTLKKVKSKVQNDQLELFEAVSPFHHVPNSLY